MSKVILAIFHHTVHPNTDILIVNYETLNDLPLNCD